jgi:hypothetical protein
LTIAAGAVTITQSVHKIDTAADGATDDLDTISGGSNDQLLLLRAENAARTVVVKNDTGNILLGGDDVELDDANKFLLLIYDSGLSKWLIAGGSGSGALKTKDVTTPAYKLTIASDSNGTILTADRTLTVDVVNGARNLDIPADQQFPATAGTVEASHVLAVDANRDLATIRNLTLDGDLTIPGYLEAPADAGEIVVINLPIVSAVIGTPQSLSFQLDSTTILKVYGESNGAGGLQNASVKCVYSALPNASDGAALGSTALMWSDLFLASGAVLNFNNGNVTITHSAGNLALAGILTATGYIKGASAFYAGMYFYESATTLAISVADSYYAINGQFSGDELDGFTFVAGSVGAGNITTAAAGAAININDAGHGLVAGDYVNVQSANHNGTSVVTYIDPDNFTLAIAFVGNEACTWNEGDYLLASTGSDGHYLLNWSATGSAGAVAKQFKIEPVKNATHIDKSAGEMTTSFTTNQSTGGTGIISLAAGDRIWLQLKNVTDTQDFNYEHANLTLIRT